MSDILVETSNDRMKDWLNSIQRERKICYFLGDLNLDLLQHEEHRPTSAFLDISRNRDDELERKIVSYKATENLLKAAKRQDDQDLHMVHELNLEKILAGH